ncbi:hypothetical protein ACP70R_025458 [Stipagrostis hirtigluma subsp. patula]
MATAATTAAPHVMVLPFPAQGHVTPLMELSHRLVHRGFEVTFVNTELTHALVLDAMGRPADGAAAGKAQLVDGIRLVCVPDGMADGEDRRDLRKFLDSVMRCVPGYVEQLIRETKNVKWLVGDVTIGVCFEAARKLGVRVAAVFPASAACLGTIFKLPQLIEDGFFDDKGLPKRHGTFDLFPGMPPLCTSQMLWCIDGDAEGKEVTFQLLSRDSQATSNLAEIVVCNSFRDAEAAAFEMFPNILPIGPLFAADGELRNKPVGQFLPEDKRCLRWLDEQPDRSVVYVAFGSFTIFNPRQFEELALGLELAGRPFLWVVRPDFTAAGVTRAWFDEFQGRVAGKGMVVSWCPQQQVLAHRAVACFVSHCGWNSTMEGVRNGVPFLCWPYFCDQHMNQSYICDIWRTGLAVSPGEDGVVVKEEVSSKVKRVVGDQGIAERARALRDAACRCLGEGGSSRENFNRFVDLLRE